MPNRPSGVAGVGDRTDRSGFYVAMGTSGELGGFSRRRPIDKASSGAVMG